MHTPITEAMALAEAATPAAGPGRITVRIINAGKGSSGVYPPETLKAAAEARVFPAGTHMYIDHPGAYEDQDRPERTVRDLAGVLAEDARWDETAQALVADAHVYSFWAPVIAEMAADIGVSIRATADTAIGEWDGQPATIITRLIEGLSVDYVTHAGRGGKILAVHESARRVREARNVGQWVESRIHRDFTVTTDEMFGDGRLTREERIALSSAIGDALGAFVSSVETNAPQLYERDLWDEPPTAAAQAVEAAVARGVTEATANDRREQLATLVKDAYAGKDVWAWVRDFDDERVWFEVETNDSRAIWQQAYATTDDIATALTGDRVEVRIRTEYVPVGESTSPTTATPPADEAAPDLPVNPAGQSTTQESEEDTMPNIEEARLRQLEEAHGRVPALESERDTAVKRAEEAEARALQAEAGTYARDFARTLVTKANPELAEASVARIVRDAIRGTLPLTEAGRLDTDAFTPVVEKARAEEETYLGQVAEASGLGSVRGVGPTGATSSVTEADFDAAVAEAFGRKGA